MHMPDAFLAAAAATRDLIVVTPNETEFHNPGVKDGQSMEGAAKIYGGFRLNPAVS